MQIHFENTKFNAHIAAKINFDFFIHRQFVFLPECCDYVGTNRDEVLALSETLKGDTVAYYKHLAKSNNVWLSLGGIHETICDDKNGEATNKLYNAHVIVNSNGELAAVYRKLHLFDVQTPQFTFRESQSVTGGNCIVSPLTDTPLPGGLGLLIVSVRYVMHMRRIIIIFAIYSVMTCDLPN